MVNKGGGPVKKEMKEKGRHGKFLPRCLSLPSKPQITILRYICALETNAHREAVFADARCIS